MIKGLSEPLVSLVKECLPDFAADYEVSVSERKEAGYEIHGGNGVYTLMFGRRCDLFRAAALTAYAAKTKEKTDISAAPQFARLGAMFDVSRGAVPTVATVKRRVRTLAMMGYNELMLYTEDLVKLDGYPYFGYMRGAYTKEELKEIVGYAEAFGIEAVPCVELLSHMEHMLVWGAHGGMRNSNRTLLVGADATYALIDTYLKTLRECFPSSRIHIGFDEAPDIAEGTYARRNGRSEAITVFEKHLSRVAEMAKGYGFTPMIWADMYFRFCSKTGAYPDPDIAFDERTKAAIPLDAEIVYWDYSNNDVSRVDRNIAATRRLGHHVVFAGGIWTMNGVCADYEMTWYAGYHACTACKKQKVDHVIVTMWGDNGGECPVDAAYPGLMMFAEANYHAGDPTKEDVARSFEACVGAPLDAFLALGLDDGYPRDKCHYHNASVTKQALYEDVMLGLFDDNFASFDIRAHFEEKYRTLTSFPVPNGYEKLFEYHTRLADVLQSKCDIGIRLTKAYRAKDHAALGDLADELFTLSEKYTSLADVAASLWYDTNKTQGYEVFDLRLGGLATRVKRAGERVKQYLAGELDSLTEYEEERLYYDAPGREKAFPLYSFWNFGRIFTANDVE